MKSQIVSKISSRKLWTAIFTFGIFVLNEQYNEALAVALAYLGMQGVVDAVDSKKGATPIYPDYENPMSQNDDGLFITGEGQTK